MKRKVKAVAYTVMMLMFILAHIGLHYGFGALFLISLLIMAVAGGLVFADFD